MVIFLSSGPQFAREKLERRTEESAVPEVSPSFFLDAECNRNC